MQVSFPFSPFAAQAARPPLQGADRRVDDTAASAGIPRVAPAARAPPARPGGADTDGAQKAKGKNKVYAVAKGFSTGLFESWEACEPQVKGFKDATFKGFALRADALAYLESHGVTTGGGQKEALPVPPPQANGLSMEQLELIEQKKQLAQQRKREREAAEAAQRAADLGAERRRDDPHRHSAAAKTRRNKNEKQRKKKRAAARAVAADEQTIEQTEQDKAQGDETAMAGTSVSAALEGQLREAALRAQIKSLKSLNGAIRKRTTRESKLAFSRGKRVQKREDADAKRAKRKKRTARQLRGIAGDARRHKKSKA